MPVNTETMEQDALDFAVSARVEMQDGKRPLNDFLFSIGKQVTDGRTLSERQLAGLLRFYEKEIEWADKRASERERDAEADDVPEGTERLTGIVVNIKLKDTPYGQSWKMVLQEDRGFRIWMTVPRRLLDMVDVATDLNGAKIEVTADVTPSDDDRVFGFGKQPRDATLVALGSEA